MLVARRTHTHTTHHTPHTRGLQTSDDLTRLDSPLGEGGGEGKSMTYMLIVEHIVWWRDISITPTIIATMARIIVGAHTPSVALSLSHLVDRSLSILSLLCRSKTVFCSQSCPPPPPPPMDTQW